MSLLIALKEIEKHHLSKKYNRVYLYLSTLYEKKGDIKKAKQFAEKQLK